MKLKCSFYGSKNENLNKEVSMFASEVCPECHGKKKIIMGISPYTERANYDNCLRCNGDGWLTNSIKFNPEAMTAACNLFPLGSWLKVTYKDKSIIVMVTDRGPGKEGRHDWIDLTRGAFSKLAPLELGVISVDVEPL
jgi:hypothetical protein